MRRPRDLTARTSENILYDNIIITYIIYDYYYYYINI